jgi:hypothetical protein
LFARKQYVRVHKASQELGLIKGHTAQVVKALGLGEKEVCVKFCSSRDVKYVSPEFLREIHVPFVPGDEVVLRNPVLHYMDETGRMIANGGISQRKRGVLLSLHHRLESLLATVQMYDMVRPIILRVNDLDLSYSMTHFNPFRVRPGASVEFLGFVGGFDPGTNAVVTRMFTPSAAWERKAWWVQIPGRARELEVWEDRMKVVKGGEKEEGEYKVGEAVKVISPSPNNQVEVCFLHGGDGRINLRQEGIIVSKKKSGKYANDHQIYAVHLKDSFRIFVHRGYLRRKESFGISDSVMRGGSMFEAIPGDKVVMVVPYEGALRNSQGVLVEARLAKGHYAIVQSKARVAYRAFDHRDDVLLVQFPGLLQRNKVFMSKDFFRLELRSCIMCEGAPEYQCDQHAQITCGVHRCPCSRPIGSKVPDTVLATPPKKSASVVDGEAYAESLRTMREDMMVPALAVIVNARQNTYSAEQHLRLEVSGQVAAAEEMAKKAIDKASQWSRSHARQLGVKKDETCPECKMGLIGTRATVQSNAPTMLAYPIRIIAVCNRCEYQRVLKRGIDPMQFIK